MNEVQVADLNDNAATFELSHAIHDSVGRAVDVSTVGTNPASTQHTNLRWRYAAALPSF